jgi:hypothetical protein
LETSSLLAKVAHGAAEADELATGTASMGKAVNVHHLVTIAVSQASTTVGAV